MDKGFELTETEIAYLIHLLKYANEELFVYSAVFLGKEHGIGYEEVKPFIQNLESKLGGYE